ncbi:hypothetical protein DUNSADRAFT_16745 [Dunaliella salina]|uniref:Fe2OG dioxygenase domain-containing protein n=1 Tax=Dunaliella salina TaxID=3046 RepID=A0ABQ7G2Y7_DUNSA|nr:hypothetical protein DUNSADRAFT_16745 [Dunaliella salina]|eukprot:KAF5828965.1 hypothetical protein DUNSADRAFT_16745 [Dunaliella salina]
MSTWWLVALLVAWAHYIDSFPFKLRKLLLPTLKSEHGFPNWRGETGGASLDDEETVQVLTWDPKIFLYKNFLSSDECDELIRQASPHLERSGVSDPKTGKGTEQKVRTSSGMFFKRGANELVQNIEERVAKWVMVPVENGEGLQVLKYNETQKYDAHHDYFSFEGRDDNGGNRMVTVLMYLSDVEEGGETVFPKVPISDEEKSRARVAGVSECAQAGLHYQPSKGDALAFWSINNDGQFEPKSLHGSCPVKKGVKWSATKWIHVGHYAIGGEAPKHIERVIYVPPPPPALTGCIDKNSMCKAWAETGECTSNPGYMVGDASKPGSCLLSCNRCDLGPNE